MKDRNLDNSLIITCPHPLARFIRENIILHEKTDNIKHI